MRGAVSICRVRELAPPHHLSTDLWSRTRGAGREGASLPASQGLEVGCLPGPVVHRGRATEPGEG